MARMSNKLTGRDFSTCSSMSTNAIQHAVDHNTLISGDTREVEHGLSVKLQVQKLIIQAKSHENLCQNYVGYEQSCKFTPLTSLSFIHTNYKAKPKGIVAFYCGCVSTFTGLIINFGQFIEVWNP